MLPLLESEGAHRVILAHTSLLLIHVPPSKC